MTWSINIYFDEIYQKVQRYYGLCPCSEPMKGLKCVTNEAIVHKLRYNKLILYHHESQPPPNPNILPMIWFKLWRYRVIKTVI